MAHVRSAISADLLKRMCPECGFRGRGLQGDRGLFIVECPSCGGDLYSRRARSYAEMEGLLEPGACEDASPVLEIPVAGPPAAPDRVERVGRFAERGLAWALGVCVVLVLTGSLASAMV